MGGGWAIAAASVTGAGHSREGTSCQDAWGIHWFNRQSGIAVVADGAGSYASSQEGAALVASCLGHSSEAVPELLGDSKSGELLKKRWHAIAWEEFRRLRQIMAEHAEASEISIDQLSCTAMVVAFSPTRLMCAHVGDGRGCVSLEPNKWQALFTPTKGEQVGETVFVTHDVWDTEDYWIDHCTVIDGPVRGFGLMTDGCERGCFRCWVPTGEEDIFEDPNEPFADFFEPNLSAVMAMHRDKLSQEDINKRWAKHLRDGLPAFAEETDDRTMILAGFSGT